MQRRKITPAIRGTFDYLDEESSHFDKYRISVGDVLVGFLYMPRASHLLPVNIYFKQEIIVNQEY